MRVLRIPVGLVQIGPAEFRGVLDRHLLLLDRHEPAGTRDGYHRLSRLAADFEMMIARIFQHQSVSAPARPYVKTTDENPDQNSGHHLPMPQ